MSSEKLHYLWDLAPLEKETKVARFYEELKKGVLTTTKCKKCDKLLWPPRYICPHCLSDSLEWVKLTGRGKIYAFTEIRHGLSAWMQRYAPKLAAIVELQEGFKIISWIENSKFEDLKIGMKVQASHLEVSPDTVILTFVPVRA